jgi:hypothetical protein
MFKGLYGYIIMVISLDILARSVAHLGERPQAEIQL